jgi:hypothetical protein
MPVLINIRTTSRCPFCDAMCSGFQPMLSLAWISAPCSIRKRTTSSLPLLDARSNDVCSLPFRMSTATPHSSKNFAMWRCPWYDACGMESSHCYPGQTRPRHSRSRSARCRGTHSLQRGPRESPPCRSGCQHLHLARPVTLRCRGAHWLDARCSESSDLLRVRLHQRSGLSRGVKVSDRDA